MEFGRIIRACRHRAGLSQNQLAEALSTTSRPDGVWSTYIGQIEKGQKVPSEELCLKLAEVLDIDFTYLFLLACQDRAETTEAKRLVQLLLRTGNDHNLSVLIAELQNLVVSTGNQGQLPCPLGGLQTPPLDQLIHCLCKNRRIGHLTVVIEQLEDFDDADWDCLESVLSDAFLT